MAIHLPLLHHKYGETWVVYHCQRPFPAWMRGWSPHGWVHGESLTMIHNSCLGATVCILKPLVTTGIIGSYYQIRAVNPSMGAHTRIHAGDGI